MSLHEDIELFMTKLNRDIDEIMEAEIPEGVKTHLQIEIERRVYAVYEPSMYVRRRDSNGGLQDRDVMVSDYDPTTKTLRVTDESRDDETGRLVAPIVESGRGYTYASIEPRPFTKIAEKSYAAEFGEDLVWCLKNKGYKAGI